MFGLFKNKGESPPDIGHEETIKEDISSEKDDNNFSNDSYIDDSKLRTSNFKIPPNQQNQTNNYELEKINARIEMFSSLIKGFNERISTLNQQIGEIRTMSLSNEKNLSKSTIEAQKVIEVVKEVSPEKLRLDYQRIDMKTATLSEKIESNKQYMETIMEELKDLKRKASVFEGTEGLLRLNDDLKKDMIEIQKLGGKVKVNADKSEQIFIELKKGFAENQKTNQIIGNLDNSYSGLRKDLERLNLQHSKVMNTDDFYNFIKNIDNKLSVFQNAFSEFERIKEENEKIKQTMDNILQMEKRNEEDIGNIGLTLGNQSIKKVGEYEQKLLSVLEVLEKTSLEIKGIKEKLSGKNYRVRDMHMESKEPEIKKEIQIEKPEIVKDIPPIENKEPDFEKSLGSEIKTIELNDNEIEKSMPAESSKKSDMKKLRIQNERKINDLLLEGGYYLVMRDLENATKICKQICSLYDPKLDSKKTIYFKIMRFYDNILKLTSTPVIINTEKEEEHKFYPINPINNRNNVQRRM